MNNNNNIVTPATAGDFFTRISTVIKSRVNGFTEIDVNKYVDLFKEDDPCVVEYLDTCGVRVCRKVCLKEAIRSIIDHYEKMVNGRLGIGLRPYITVVEPKTITDIYNVEIGYVIYDPSCMSEQYIRMVTVPLTEDFVIKPVNGADVLLSEVRMILTEFAFFVSIENLDEILNYARKYSKEWTYNNIVTTHYKDVAIKGLFPDTHNNYLVRTPGYDEFLNSLNGYHDHFWNLVDRVVTAA